MRRFSLVTQLQAISTAIRMMNSNIKPTKAEREYLGDVLEYIREQLERAIERGSKDV